MQEILERFIKMPIDSADGVLEAFAALPGAVYGKGQGSMQRYVYIPGTRKDRIVLVAHADTVWDKAYGKPAQQEIILEKGYYHGTNPACGIGADDRSGCALLWAFKDSGHSLLVLDGEEKGKIGARYLRKSAPKIYREINHHRFMIEFDWKYNGACLYNQVNNTAQFKDYIQRVLGYTESPKGGGCDLQILCRRVCGVNVGTGCENIHSSKEYLSLEKWLKTYEDLSVFLKADHPCFKIPLGVRIKVCLRSVCVKAGIILKKILKK